MQAQLIQNALVLKEIKSKKIKDFVEFISSILIIFYLSIYKKSNIFIVKKFLISFK
jgi:hypothetical protein